MIGNDRKTARTRRKILLCFDEPFLLFGCWREIVGRTGDIGFTFPDGVVGGDGKVDGDWDRVCTGLRDGGIDGGVAMVEICYSLAGLIW